MNSLNEHKIIISNTNFVENPVKKNDPLSGVIYSDLKIVKSELISYFSYAY